MKLRYLTTCIATALLAMSSPSHAAASLCDATAGNLVANCGFESGTFSGWNVSGNDVPGQEGNLYGVESGADPFDGISPHSGDNQAFFADLLSNRTTISQTLLTPANKAFKVTFFVAQDTLPSQAAGNGNALTVTFDGVSETLTQVPVEGYTQVSFTAFVNSPTALLSLSFGNGLGEFLLDDVSVTELPEPGILSLLGVAALGLGLSSRRRRR